MRRAIAAVILLLLAVAPAAAQVCPPVPALPDTERRTQYSATAQTGPFSVGFQLYGDSTDYGNWLGVYVNGTLQNPLTYTVTSPTTTLATGCRPITDAVVNFTTAQTGTIQIVGARRPRRASQFGENAGVPARSINQVVTDLTAQNREQWDTLLRVLQAPPGETLALMPSAAARAGGLLGFDANGNPVPATASGGLQGPAGPAGPAGTNGCITNVRLAKTANYTVQPADSGSTIALGGAAFFTLTFSAPSGYAATFCALVLNEDAGRAKDVAISGGTTFRLYPGQSAIVFNTNNVWKVHGRPGRWRLAGNTTIFINQTSGLDTNDGLAAGAGNALQTLQKAWDTAADNFDCGGTNQITIQGANQAYTAGVKSNKQPPGCWGTASMTIDLAGGSITTTTGPALSFGSNNGFGGCVQVQLSNMTLQTGGAGNDTLQGFGGCTNVALAAGMVFATTSNNHMYFGHGAFLLGNSYTVLGGSTGSGYHAFAYTGAFVAIEGSNTITCSGTPSFFGWAGATETATLSFGGATFSGCGGVTGAKFSATLNAVITTSTGDINKLPGSTPGATATGGQYN